MNKKLSYDKGSIIAISLNSLMKDISIWGDPENFRPERHLDQEGNLIQNESYTPFGTGKSISILASVKYCAYLIVYCYRKANVFGRGVGTEYSLSIHSVSCEKIRIQTCSRRTAAYAGTNRRNCSRSQTIQSCCYSA